MIFWYMSKQKHTRFITLNARVTMTISLHGGISHAQAAPEAQLPQEASATLRNVLHHPTLRERDGEGNERESDMTWSTGQRISCYVTVCTKAYRPRVKPWAG